MTSVKDILVRKPSEDEVGECKKWPVWSCGVSEFDWDYTQSEMCLILEGEVTVSDRPAGDESVTFGAGDYVELPIGLKCVWKVTQAVRKHYSFS